MRYYCQEEEFPPYFFVAFPGAWILSAGAEKGDLTVRRIAHLCQVGLVIDLRNPCAGGDDINADGYGVAAYNRLQKPRMIKNTP